MKRKLLVLGILFLSFSRMFAAIDISNTDYVNSLLITSSDTYTGQNISHSLVLIDVTGGEGNYKDMFSGTDYDLVITFNNAIVVTDMKDAGTYTFTITGKGDYEQTLVINQTVAPAQMSSVTAEGVLASYPYTGSAIDPSVTSISLHGFTLPDFFYTAADGENTDVSTGGTIKVLPISANLTGEKVITFAITPMDISLQTTVVQLESDSYDFTGAAITPVIQFVTVNGTPLATTDYTATGTDINAGPASVTIQGIGNYTGSVAEFFTIAQVALTNDMVTVADQTYTGSAIYPKPVVKLGDVTFVEDVDYTVSYPDAGEGAYTRSDIPHTVRVDAIISGNLTGVASTQFLITGGTTGVINDNAKALKVYGENGILSIESEQSASVSVYDLTGKQVYQGTVGKESVDISLAKGVYLVKVGTKVTKVVIR